MLLKDLNELVDILHEITAPADNDVYFTDENVEELVNDFLHIMKIYVTDNPKEVSEPDFEDSFFENVKDLFIHSFKTNPFFGEETEDDFDYILNYAMDQFFNTFMPRRSHEDAIIVKKLTPQMIQHLEIQIQYLADKPQPAQRTKEWYEFRQNLITASNAYKAFENESARNQLIYEKCNIKNFEEEDGTDIQSATATATATTTATKSIKYAKMVNINTTLHWGQKYEPVSVMLYEDKYNTKVQDFGCIQHEKYSFIGASPDGINVDKTSPRYGRMLEIKNIVNREIDGIPKKEYWIQMQMQMETCKLDECDFIETKFTEYESVDQFLEDGEFLLNDNEEQKGIIMYFADNEGNPKYIHKPIKMGAVEFEEWENNMLNLMQGPEYGYMWIQNYYWRLEIFSCVLVERNQFWFEQNIHELATLWEIVKAERVTGFQHRAPNRKNSTRRTDSNANGNSNIGGGCLLKLNKLTGQTNITPTEKKNETKTYLLLIYFITMFQVIY